MTPGIGRQPGQVTAEDEAKLRSVVDAVRVRMDNAEGWVNRKHLPAIIEEATVPYRARIEALTRRMLDDVDFDRGPCPWCHVTRPHRPDCIAIEAAALLAAEPVPQNPTCRCGHKESGHLPVGYPHGRFCCGREGRVWCDCREFAAGPVPAPPSEPAALRATDRTPAE